MIAIVLKDYDAAFLYNFVYYLIFIYYNNVAVDMQLCALLTRIQCKVSDTQVTVKASGPLVPQIHWYLANVTELGIKHLDASFTNKGTCFLQK